MVQLLVENGANIDVAMTGTATPWILFTPVVAGNSSARLRVERILGRATFAETEQLLALRALHQRIAGLIGDSLALERLLGKSPPGATLFPPGFIASGLTALSLAALRATLKSYDS